MTRIIEWKEEESEESFFDRLVEMIKEIHEEKKKAKSSKERVGNDG